MIPVDLGFAHSYRVEVLDGYPLSQRYTAVNLGGLSDPSKDIAIRVDPIEGEEWLGLVGPEYPTPPAVSGVFSTPLRDWLCVVAGGRALAIRADDPSKRVEIPVFPVTGVLAAVGQNLLLFADFTSITAWDGEGVRWTTGQVSWDGIRLGSVKDPAVLTGEGWSAPENRFVPFEVDLRDGSHRGGASLPSRPGAAE